MPTATFVVELFPSHPHLRRSRAGGRSPVGSRGCDSTPVLDRSSMGRRDSPQTIRHLATGRALSREALGGLVSFFLIRGSFVIGADK